MSQSRLAKVIEEVKRLTGEERDALRRTLEQWPPEPAEPMMTEEEFAEEMLRKGVFSSIPDRKGRRRPREPLKPIEIEGEPLSEQIIRERR